MNWRVRPSTVSGIARVPGDKSIAHRALMLAGIADGESHIANLPDGADVRATADCMAGLGVVMSQTDGHVSVRSGSELSEPTGPLDARNSGTTMRLLAGVLAGQQFSSRLVGDASLSRRPMGRVVDPLRLMGAEITSADGKPPLAIREAPLHGITYRLPVDSAQVKSAVLLAGLFAEGRTAVVERIPTRDHTERMLGAAGVAVERAGGTISVAGGSRPAPFQCAIPGDPSSAYFLLAAAALTGGAVEVPDLCLNPTRLGLGRVLAAMGAAVDIAPVREEMGEPVGVIRVSGDATVPATITGDEVPAVVDELPLVALIATQADGVTEVRGAQELRVKETDRIAAVVEGLSRLGARIDERPDGFVVHGPTPLRGAWVRSQGDHRLAMTLAVAGLIADGETLVEGVEAAAISFPGFAGTLQSLGGSIDVC